MERRPRKRVGWLGGVPAAALLALVATGATSAGAASPIHTQILFPLGRHPVCAGSTQLLGSARRPGAKALGRHGRLPKARWSYSSGGDFHRIHGPALPLGAAGVPVLRTVWNTRHVPAGKTDLRLRIGRHSGVATSSFKLDRPPVIGPITASTDTKTGLVTLTAASAHDPGHPAHPPHLTWFLGDGTKERGKTVEHMFEPGDYIVDVEAEDGDHCGNEKVVDLSVPVKNNNEDLSEVNWCDPLDALIRTKGESFGFWPPDVGTNPESKDAPQKVELGRRQGGGFAVAFGFETRMRVLGNPEKCQTRQVIKGRYVWEDKQKGKQGYTIPVRPKYADDGYDQDYRFRKTSPSGKADGTSEISWLDFPGVRANDDITKAQVKATFIDVVNGQEAPITHTEQESDKGESAFLRFSVCAAWNQPDGTKDSDYTLHEKKEPDAAFPDAAKPEKLAEKDDFFFGDTTSTVTGCGPK